jgi:hypothetical protein
MRPAAKGPMSKCGTYSKIRDTKKEERALATTVLDTYNRACHAVNISDKTWHEHVRIIEIDCCVFGALQSNRERYPADRAHTVRYYGSAGHFAHEPIAALSLERETPVPPKRNSLFQYCGRVRVYFSSTKPFLLSFCVSYVHEFPFRNYSDDTSLCYVVATSILSLEVSICIQTNQQESH